MNLEAFINTEKFIIADLQAVKSNGAIKLFQGFLKEIHFFNEEYLFYKGKTCVICMVFGPFQSNLSKNYKSFFNEKTYK